MKTMLPILLATGVCLAVDSGLSAQETPPESEASALIDPRGNNEDEDIPPGVRISVDAGTTHQFSTGIDSAGDFSLTRFFSAVSVRVPLEERWTVTGRLLYDLSHYNFDGVERFGGRDPWTDIHTLALNATISYQVDSAWSVFGGPILIFSGESNADVEDTISGGGVLGATWSPRKDLRLGLGVTVVSALEDDVQVFPLILLNWRFAEQWTLRSATLDAGAIGGGGLEVAHHLTDQWTLAAGVVFQSARFRLDDRGFAPEGVGENRRVPIFLRAAWNPSRQVGLSVLGGVTVGGELTIEDRDGNRLFREDYDPSPFVGVNLVLRF